MDVLVSPFITIIANIIADILVSKGILDSSSKVAVIQSINTAVAGLMTFGVAAVTIFKAVELAMHKATLQHQALSATKTETVTTVTAVPTTIETGQSGIPTEIPNNTHIVPTQPTV